VRSRSDGRIPLPKQPSYRTRSTVKRPSRPPALRRHGGPAQPATPHQSLFPEAATLDSGCAAARRTRGTVGVRESPIVGVIQHRPHSPSDGAARTSGLGSDGCSGANASNSSVGATANAALAPAVGERHRQEWITTAPRRSAIPRHAHRRVQGSLLMATEKPRFRPQVEERVDREVEVRRRGRAVRAGCRSSPAPRTRAARRGGEGVAPSPDGMPRAALHQHHDQPQRCRRPRRAPGRAHASSTPDRSERAPAAPRHREQRYVVSHARGTRRLRFRP
jgi:hypothetical protein